MPSSAPYLILLQIIFVLSWSSGFIGARLGTEEAGAINLLFWRFLLVSICLLPFVLHRLRTLSWAQVRYNTVIGFFSPVRLSGQRIYRHPGRAAGRNSRHHLRAPAIDHGIHEQQGPA